LRGDSARAHAAACLIARQNKGDVFFWNVDTKKQMARMQAGRSVHSAILWHDGKRAVTAHGDGVVRLWDLDKKLNGTRETVIVENLITRLRISPDGKRFVVVPVTKSAPVTIDVWDFETGQIVQSLEHKDVSVSDIAFSPDGSTLATGCRRTIKKDGDVYELGGEIRFWDVASGKEKQTLRGKIGAISGLAFAPDGKTLAVGLWHKENVKLKGESFEEGLAQSDFSGVIVLCEFKESEAPKRSEDLKEAGLPSEQANVVIFEAAKSQGDTPEAKAARARGKEAEAELKVAEARAKQAQARAQDVKVGLKQAQDNLETEKSPHSADRAEQAKSVSKVAEVQLKEARADLERAQDAVDLARVIEKAVKKAGKKK
jgi:hypothetical protein